MADLSGMVGAAASGFNPITAIVGLGKDLIDKFIPDPAAKAAAAQHLADEQMTLQLAVMDQQTKLIQQAGQNIQNDKLSKPRALFCYAVIAAFFYNLVLCKFVHQIPVEIPGMYIAAFVALMLGEAGVNMAQNVAMAPGESSTSLLGFVKATNKS